MSLFEIPLVPKSPLEKDYAKRAALILIGDEVRSVIMLFTYYYKLDLMHGRIVD